MAKLDLKRQRIFANWIGITGGIAQYGSMQADAKVYSDDPDVLQALTAFSTGFGGGSIPPALEDMNGLFYLFTRQLSYLYQAGISEWNASATYYIGSLVCDSTSAVFMSMVDSNTNNALTDQTKWMTLISSKVTTLSSLDYTVVASDRFIVNPIGPIADNRTITLPAPSAANIGRLMMIKQTGATSGGSYVTLNVKANDNSTIDGSTTNVIAQYVCKKYICDGTNWRTT